MLQYNEFVHAIRVDTVPRNPRVTQPVELVAIPIQQAATTVTYVQPVSIPAIVPTHPMVTASG